MNDYSDSAAGSLATNSADKNKRNVILLGGCLVMMVCAACLAVITMAGGVMAWQEYGNGWLLDASPTEVSSMPTLAATVELETTFPVATTVKPALATPDLKPNVEETAVPAAPQVQPNPDLVLSVPDSINQGAVTVEVEAVLDELYVLNYPAHDPFEAAVRLNGYVGERTIPAQSREVGDTQIFYHNGDEVEATLAAITDHSYFWVQNGLNLEATAVAQAANRFEREYYGSLVNLFGQMWDPGIDNDPRFSVLHVTGGEESELGYFYSENEYPRSLFEDSNQQEMIYLNMDSLTLDDALYDATLIHEVQHLIQWNMDPNETAWLNEGLSQLAEIYMGFSDTAETVDYLDKPEIQLNSWSYDDEEVYAHYSAAYLLSLYVWEQLGQTAVQELARHPANGLASIKAVLQGYAPEMTMEQFVADWAAANYLDSQNMPNPDPRYSYQHLNINTPRIQDKVDQGVAFDQVQTLAQFGVHYLDLTDLRGETTLSFAGDRTTQLIASEIGSAERFWYTPPMDEVNASLTQAFNLSNETQANLTYSVWYDLEEDYDYAFVSISTDGGASWVKLQPVHAEDGVYGYNGRSADKKGSHEGWLEESLSLNQFVGNNVIVRFDVLTDSAITGQGFALDHIAVTGSDNATTLADEMEGWQAEGFVYTNGQLPQKWTVTLLTTDPNTRNAVVTPIALNALNQAQTQIDFGKDGGVLIIMPQTPFVTNPANYWLTVTQ